MTIDALPTPTFTGADLVARHDSTRGLLNALPVVVTEATVAAIQAAIDAAQARAADNGGGEVWLPSGTYALGTSGLTLPIGVGLRADAGATLTYSGTGTALTIEGDASHGVRHLDLPNIERTGDTPGWFDGSDTSSVGVDLRGCMYEQIRARKISGFRTGFWFRAIDGSGLTPSRVGNCVCNTLHLGQLRNNRFGLRFAQNTTNQTSGANQNTIIGGVIRIDTAYRMAESFYCYLPDAENNANTFIGINMEDAAGGVDAIWCDSYNNTWLNCRFENAAESGGVKPIRFGASSSKNHIWGTMTVVTQNGPWTDIVADASGANDYFSDGALAAKKVKLDLTGGKLLFGNGTAVPDVPIQSYGADGLWFGDSSTTRVRYFGGMWQETFSRTTSNTVLPTTIGNCIELENAFATVITGTNAAMPTDMQGVVTVISYNGNSSIGHTASPADGDGKFVTKSGATLALTAKQPVQFMLSRGNFYEI